MNNNLLLKQAIGNNPVFLKHERILTDELFQIVRTETDSLDYIRITIYKPLNYGNTKQFTSHNTKQAKHYYIKNGNFISFMLDEHKTKEIDTKHDNLRFALH